MSKLHRDNAGYVGCSYEDTQDPYYSYNKLSLPLSGATETVQRPAEVTHTVTVAGGKFVIGGVSQATLSLIEGGTYKFDQSDSSNSTHPFKFSQTSDGTHNRGTEYTKGVTYVGTPGSSGAYTQLVVPFGGLDLYYYCGNHSGMGGSASTPANAGMFTAALPILKTTDQFGKTLGSGTNADPFAANLMLALPMNGSNGGTTFTDQSAAIRGSGTAKSITLYSGSASGGAVISTDQSIYYGSSFYAVRGATNNYTASDYIARSGDNDLAFGTADFTVEFWFQPTTLVSNCTLFDNRHPSTDWPNSTAGFQFFTNAAGDLYFRTGSGYPISVSGVLTAGVWSHIAITRSSGTVYLYADGNLLGAAQVTNDFNEGRFTLGSASNNGEGSTGYYSDLRIYKGVAKYQPEGSGSLGMEVVAYTGDGNSSRSISSLSFSPDLVWFKNRGTANYHQLHDRVRGPLKRIYSNSTDAENNYTTALTSFDSNGWTMGNGTPCNASGNNYVAWCWKAGGAGTTITAGSLNSSAYDQSQTWSGGSTSGTLFSGNFTQVFNGVITQTYSDGNSAYVYQNSATYTFPSAITGTIEVWVRAGSSGANGDNVTVTDGTTVYSTGNVTSQTAAYVSINNGNSISGITSITVNSGGSSQAGMVLGAIKLNGKMLVDSGISVTNVPSIASTVSANNTYGFSIAKYTGTGANASFGHALSSAPNFILVKKLTAASWNVYHSGIGATKTLELNGSGAEATAASWNSTAPTSSVVSVGNYPDTNDNGGEYIAYSWSEVSGFSKFGSYSGGTNPKTVTTGFKPGFLIIKRTDTANHWMLIDSDRGGTQKLGADLNVAENDLSTLGDAAQNIVEFLNDGFKLTTTNAGTNVSGGTYIYAAWAESAPGDPGQDAFKILETLNTKDQSSSAHTVTNNGASFQTSVKKFYGGSTNLTNSTNSYLTIPNSDDFNFGGGDWTCELWVYPTSTTSRAVMTRWGETGQTTASWAILSNLVYLSNNGGGITTTINYGQLGQNQWSHLAVVRQGNTVTVYVNGNPTASGSFSGSLYQNNFGVNLGNYGTPNNTTTHCFDGYIQDVRVYKGIAKYTSSFSPPERSIQGTARRYPSGVYVVS